MDDGEHSDQIGWFVDHVDDDIAPFNEFSCPLDQTGPADVRKTGHGKPIDTRTNAMDQFSCRPGAILRYPLENALKIGGGCLVDDDFHSPSRRRIRSLNSSSDKRRAFGSD